MHNLQVNVINMLYYICVIVHLHVSCKTVASSVCQYSGTGEQNSDWPGL